MSYNISNEHLLLIDILNGMYNDNARQITTLNNSIQGLRENNNQIRNLLIQILHNQPRRSNTRNNRQNINNRLNNLSQDNVDDRVYINNIPYIIDSIQYYSLPTSTTLNTQGQTRNEAGQTRNEAGQTRNEAEQTRNEAGQTRNEAGQTRNSLLSRGLQSFFQPIEVFPSQIQIETATRIARYADIVNPNNTSCPISLTPFNDNDNVTVIRHCGHIFNSVELTTWFRSNCRCPVCRYDIRNSSSRTNDGPIEPNENVERNENVDNIDDSLNMYFSDFSNSTDATSLFSLFSSLQRRHG